MRGRILGGRSTSSLGGSLWRRTRFKNRWTRCWIHYALKRPRVRWMVGRSRVITHFNFTFVARR
jgi:hypothetical protein